MASPSQSVSAFVKLIREKQELYKSRMANLVSLISLNNQEDKIKAAEQALEAATDLRANLAATDVPFWLQNGIEALNEFKNENKTSGSNNKLLTRLFGIYAPTLNHRWMPENFQSDNGISFDEIYDKCKKESQIDELFEEIARIIIKIIESEDLDSIKIKNTLEGLLSTLNNHNKKSYFDLVCSFDFVVSLFKNILWEQLESIPALGPILKGLRKTLDDTNDAMEKLHDKMKIEIFERKNTEVSFLTYKNKNLLK